MALYRPTNITPSSFSGLGNGTIDVTKDLQVSWQVEGSSAMTAYQIIIQENTTESTQVYDSGKVALTDPFFGVDFNGMQQRYTTVIPAASLAALSNGYENGYKLKIKEWWSENDSVEQVQPAFFNTRTTPTLVMDSVASPLNLRRYTFHASYTQAEGDVLNWFRWYVAEEGHEDAPLKDTGNIYGTGDVRCTYDGFFTGNSYSVRCICETENGIQADTGWVTFDVAYQMSELTGVLEVRKPPVQDALLISWAAIRFINGSADGDYSVNDGILELPDGSSVTWDQVNGAGMRFEPPWSLAWKGKIPVNAATLLTIQEDGTSLVLSYNNDGFTIKRDGATIFYLPVYICIDDVWTILIEPDRIRFRMDCMAGGLYPSNDLFPSETLYPAAGVMTAFQFEKAWTREQSAFTGVTLHGPQRCDWLWVYAGAFREEDALEMLYGNGFEPEYSEGSYMTVNFKDNLNGGNLKSPNEEIIGLSIYRMRSGEARLFHLVDVPLTETRLMDYGFRNQEACQYFLFPQGEQTYISAPLTSVEVRPASWNWTLLVCREDENGVFHEEAQYVFRNNVVSGSVTNNSTPGILKNFTQYPVIQPDSANYRSGMLSALIGRVDTVNNVYVDSIQLAEELYALAADIRPKFLKDRKGNLMRVEVSAAIVMTVGDNQAPQPYTIQLPWAECGDAADASIVKTEADGIPSSICST